MQRTLINDIYIVIILNIFILILCWGCTSNDNIVKYEKFPTEYSLSADSVSTKKIYDNVFMNLTDSLLVVSSFKADTMMHFYSTPALRYKFSTGAKGHGSNEMQSFPTFCKTLTKNLYVRGYTENTIRKFHLLDTQILEDERYNISLTEVPNDMHVIHDSLLYYNDLTNMEIKSYNLRERKITHTFRLLNIYEENKDALIGYLCLNDTSAIYAFQYKREILVLRPRDLAYVKTVTWDYKNQHTILSNPKRHPILYYTNGFVSPKYFYLLYRGSTPLNKDAHFSIEKYDNNMTPICKYNLDRKLFKFVVDEANSYIYGFGENDDYIYRYKLPKN